MKLYLVRHGESRGNIANIHQNEHTPLSETGVKQAMVIAKRFRHIPIDIIFASDMKRAAHTAEEINEIVKKQIIFTDLLREIKRPTEIEGKRVFSEQVIKIKKKLTDHWDDPNWYYSDEENFYDVRERGLKFLNMIELRREENILAVSHGYFIRILLGSMIWADALTPKIFLGYAMKLMLKNTGLTVCEHTEKGWKLITWNDHAHLG